MKSSIISAEQLVKLFSDPNTIVLDVSPSSNKSGLVAEFPDEMISGAHLVSIKEELSKKNSNFPNTFPTVDQFDTFCRSTGISSNSTVVIYDNLGIYSSPRLWWIFKVMGFKNVAVLDGGLSAWKKSGGQTTARIKLERPNNGDFKSQPDLSRVKDFSDIDQNIKRNDFLLVDARSEGRFNGISPEPRKHLKSGHIQHSINIPFARVLDNGCLKSKNSLKEIFTDCSTSNELVFTCGSGMTACILRLAAEQIFEKDMAVYDGSWTEWAEKKQLFVE